MYTASGPFTDPAPASRPKHKACGMTIGADILPSLRR